MFNQLRLQMAKKIQEENAKYEANKAAELRRQQALAEQEAARIAAQAEKAIQEAEQKRLELEETQRVNILIEKAIQEANGSISGTVHSEPIRNTELAWKFAQKQKIKPFMDGKKDYYIIPFGPSGYAGGYGGQLDNFSYITIITEHASNRVITAFPSSKTPPLDLLIKFYRKFGETHAPKISI